MKRIELLANYNDFICVVLRCAVSLFLSCTMHVVMLIIKLVNVASTMLH